MQLAFGVFPNSRELSLTVDLYLLGHCSQSAVLYDHVLNLAWSCVEVFGELVVEVEGKDVRNCCHLHGKAVDVSISDFRFETSSEVATCDCLSPAALAIEDQYLLCFPRIPHASAKEDQPCQSISFREFRLEAIHIHVLRTHLHSLPIPTSFFLLGDHGLPVLEVAVVEADTIDPDPSQNRRNIIASPLPTAITLSIPFSLPIAVRVTFLRLIDHLRFFPYTSTTQVISRHYLILFPYVLVSTSRQVLGKNFLCLEDQRQQDDQTEEQSHLFVQLIMVFKFQSILVRMIQTYKKER